MDEAERLKVQLAALTHSPKGAVDDTRFEKLLDRLTPYITEDDNKLKLFIDNGGLDSIEKGLAVDDPRVVAIGIRLVGLMASLLPFDSPSNLLHAPTVIKLMESLLAPTNIDMDVDALVRNSCILALTAATRSSVALDWMVSAERCNRLVAFIFRSFSDSSIFVATTATELLCKLATKGPYVEQRLIESGLKRRLDVSMTEIPSITGNEFDEISSPPPLHHNKICLIDLAIALHNHSAASPSPIPPPSALDISLSSILGLLMDEDRHVRSRMVEAIQIIGIDPQTTNNDLENRIYDMAYKLVASGEGDFILTGIDLVGALHGISDGSMRKFFDLVLGVIVPVFGKVVSVPEEVVVPKTFPVRVDLPHVVLLQSVLDCLKHMLAYNYVSILPGSLVVDLTLYGLAGGETYKLAYVRECQPAFEITTVLLTHTHDLVHKRSWITTHQVQRLLNTLLMALARSWSAFSVKIVVSLLGDGKLERKIFQDFGDQLRDSITKGFASEESDSREHVVAFIGTLLKEDVSQTAIDYYTSSGFHNIVIKALADQDPSVRSAALDSLQYVCAEQSIWDKILVLSDADISALMKSYSPTGTGTQQSTKNEFLAQVVGLLYDEDPYAQRACISFLSSWTTNKHTQLATYYLVWNNNMGLKEGLAHTLHGSDWDSQVQSIQLLRSIYFSLGAMSFFAVKGHTLVSEMMKNCEERVSQKAACAALLDIREDFDKVKGEPSQLLSPPLGDEVMAFFREELRAFYAHIQELDLATTLQNLSDEHLYDEDEEEDLVLRYQDIHADDMDCD